MVVFSKITGQLSGILLDEGWLTDLRTAAAGSVVARHMAPKKIKAIGVIGTGIQARFQVQILRAVTDCRHVVIWGRDSKKMALYKKDVEKLGFKVTLAKNVAQVGK